MQSTPPPFAAAPFVLEGADPVLLLNPGGSVNLMPGSLGTSTGGVVLLLVKPNWPALKSNEPPALFNMTEPLIT
jgi:hypothetical protein